MKKILLVLTFILIFFLCGCSMLVSDNQIETLADWSFQFNEGTDDYSIFFGLLNNFEKDYVPCLKIAILGEKIYGNNNLGYDIIGYKLYDSDGNLIDANNIYLSALSKGDKFKNDSIEIYDVIPGESYVLKLTEYDYW